MNSVMSIVNSREIFREPTYFGSHVTWKCVFQPFPIISPVADWHIMDGWSPHWWADGPLWKQPFLSRWALALPFARVPSGPQLWQSVWSDAVGYLCLQSPCLSIPSSLIIYKLTDYTAYMHSPHRPSSVDPANQPVSVELHLDQTTEKWLYFVSPNIRRLAAFQSLFVVILSCHLISFRFW